MLMGEGWSVFPWRLIKVFTQLELYLILGVVQDSELLILLSRYLRHFVLRHILLLLKNRRCLWICVKLFILMQDSCIVSFLHIITHKLTHVGWIYDNHAYLTHWGRVTHICVGNLTITGSNNGLSPGRRQAIIWTNAGIFLIRPLGTNSSEILIEILTFSFKKMRLKGSSAKWRPFCLGLNVLSMRIASGCWYICNVSFIVQNYVIGAVLEFRLTVLWLLLLTWFNFNPTMDK